MTKKIKLPELCCANCAAKIEEKVAKIKGVESCTVNYLTEKLIIEVADEETYEALKPAVTKAVRKIEPDIEPVFS